MTEAKRLTDQIRGKILAGQLPKEHCRMTWFGPGRSATCAACDRLIEAHDVEVECDLPEGGTLPFHRRCYDVWVEMWPLSGEA